MVVVQAEMSDPRVSMMFNIGWILGLFFGMIAGLTLGYHIWA